MSARECWLVILDDGRFVAMMMGRRYFVREYPDAHKFTKREARTCVYKLAEVGVLSAAVHEQDYAKEISHEQRAL